MHPHAISPSPDFPDQQWGSTFSQTHILYHGMEYHDAHLPIDPEDTVLVA